MPQQKLVAVRRYENRALKSEFLVLKELKQEICVGYMIVENPERGHAAPISFLHYNEKSKKFEAAELEALSELALSFVNAFNKITLYLGRAHESTYKFPSEKIVKD